MNTREIDDLLTLLAITVLADRKVLDTEIKAFVEAAFTLQKSASFDEPFNGPHLVSWFNSHQAVLSEIMDRDDIQERLENLFQRLAHIPKKQSIINCMRQIAVSDGDVHISECSLTEIAATHWGVDVSSLPMPG